MTSTGISATVGPEISNGGFASYRSLVEATGRTLEGLNELTNNII